MSTMPRFYRHHADVRKYREPDRQLCNNFPPPHGGVGQPVSRNIQTWHISCLGRFVHQATYRSAANSPTEPSRSPIRPQDRNKTLASGCPLGALYRNGSPKSSRTTGHTCRTRAAPQRFPPSASVIASPDAACVGDIPIWHPTRPHLTRTTAGFVGSPVCPYKDVYGTDGGQTFISGVGVAR